MLDRTLLEVAADITSGDRMESYGHPLINFLREALTFSILEGRVVSPLDIVRQYYVKKLCREYNRFKWDNHVDMAGYAATMDSLDRAMRELGYPSGVKNFERMGGWLPAVHFMASLLEMARERYELARGGEVDIYMPHVAEAARNGVKEATTKGVTLE